MTDLTHSDEYLTISEAAAWLSKTLARKRRIASSTLWRWRNGYGTNGVRLEMMKCGRAVVVSKAAIERFIRELNAPLQTQAPHVRPGNTQSRDDTPL